MQHRHRPVDAEEGQRRTDRLTDFQRIDGERLVAFDDLGHGREDEVCGGYVLFRKSYARDKALLFQWLAGGAGCCKADKPGRGRLCLTIASSAIVAFLYPPLACTRIHSKLESSAGRSGNYVVMSRPVNRIIDVPAIWSWPNH